MIKPIFAWEDELSLAKTLIAVFKEHVGKRRGELDGGLSRCEDLGYDYRLVRGLSAVLEGLCVFEARNGVSPPDARRLVFGLAGGSVVASEGDRERILVQAARELGASPPDIEGSLYADLPEEQTLSEFDEPEPRDLLREYNFSLVSTVLSRARRIELTYAGRDRALEDLAQSFGGSIKSSSRATTSIIELNRSGRAAGSTKLEKVILGVTQSSRWAIAADVIHPHSGKKYSLHISSEEVGRMITPRALKAEDKRGKRKSPLLGDVVIIEELAQGMGVTEAEARRMLEGVKGGYVDIGGVFITRGKLAEIRENLGSLTDMRLSRVQAVLRRLGCRNPLPVLDALGYTVDWEAVQGDSRVYKVGKR